MTNILNYIDKMQEMYEGKPSSTVPGPRNMYADSMRPGFYRGESVVKSHGQKLIELTEAGESSVSIAKKLGLKQQTVSNALNAIDSGTAGDNYKLSKPLKDLQIPKNQFSGKELTKNTELIEAIKKDAPTMSDKEIKAKYDIHKNTLKKIKNENDITTRSSYLPEGKQKKSIPYAERYTAQEKSDMYKKRKETETDEDRAKAKERDKKYRDKKFKEYRMEPSSRSPYDDLWKDIARSSKEGDRIQLVDGPKYSSGASYDDFKTRVFLDTKTGKTFNYNNLKQYLDSGKLEGVTYKNVIEPYDLKNKIAKSGLKEDIQKAYFGDKYQPPKPFRAQNTFHVHHIGGVAVDPFSVQLTFADENLGLVTNKKFNKEWSSLIERNAPLSERKNYLKFVKKQIGDNIAQTLEFPEVGKVKTYGEIGTDMQKLLSNKKFKNIDTKQILQKINETKPKLAKEVSMRLNSGIPLDDLMVELKKIPGLEKTARNLTRGFTKAGGPFEVGFVGLDMFNELSKGKTPRQSFKTAVSNITFGMYEGGKREDMRTLINTAKNLNIDSTGFNKLKELIDLEKTIEKEKINLKKTFQYKMNPLSIEKYKNKVNDLEDKFMNKSIALQEEVNIDNLINNYSQTVESLAKQQFEKSKNTKSQQVYPEMGSMGSNFMTTVMNPIESFLPQNLMETGLGPFNIATRPVIRNLKKIPFIGSIFNPTSDAAKLSAMSQEKKNKRIEEYAPSVMQESVKNFYADGGIAGLSGGDKSGPPPESGPASQGLRSLYKNGRKL